jgi:hypothetical protein
VQSQVAEGFIFLWDPRSHGVFILDDGRSRFRKAVFTAEATSKCREVRPASGIGRDFRCSSCFVA